MDHTEYDTYTHHHDRDESERGSRTIGIIVVIIVVILIIALIIWWARSDMATTPTGTSSPIWTNMTGGTGTTDSFTANNFTIYSAASSTSALTLTLVPPSTATGQQFIVDNSSGRPSITLTGVTISPASSTIAASTVVEFIWTSQTTILRVTG